MGKLVFTKGPLDTMVTSKLSLRNPMNDDKEIFKVKTTAPKQYCIYMYVSPHCGIIDPQVETEIAVTLQPCDLSTVDKSEIMVQSMVAPADFQADQLNTIWKNTERYMFSGLTIPLVPPPPPPPLIHGLSVDCRIYNIFR